MAETTITIDSMITVGSLAEKIQIPVTKIITELMKNGIMATVNEKIDFDTAQIIVSELGLNLSLVQSSDEQKEIVSFGKVKTNSKTAVSRPPVVAVMGHVDHGKTSLLDAIRHTNTVSKEAGGITQHISAYQVDFKKRKITFLDTPGHEAFAAIREHGAHLTDIVIIVIAADDGIKPQTIEAIRFAQKAEVKIIVAINKIDKENADVARVKQQLAEQNLLIEEWGGDIVVVEVSAKTGQGIDKLLEMVLLVTDIEELKAELDVPSSGLIIESHIEQGRGPVVFALIESGKLTPGNFVVSGGNFGKIRILENTDGLAIKEALPGTPVKITGFKTLPEFGDSFSVVSSEKEARERVKNNEINSTSVSGDQISSTELLRLINRNNEVQKLNIIIKADVKGSLTSVIDSLKSLNTEEVEVLIVGSGIGPINDNDIHLAKTSSSIIYGFNSQVSSNIKQQAERDRIKIRNFKIIYELIDDVKAELTAMLQPEIVETELGRVIVRAVFATSKTEIICGGLVTKGKVSIPALAKIYRGSDLIGEVELVNLKRGQMDVKEVLEEELCGMSLSISNQKLSIQIDDKLEFFERKVVSRTL